MNFLSIRAILPLLLLGLLWAGTSHAAETELERRTRLGTAQLAELAKPRPEDHETLRLIQESGDLRPEEKTELLAFYRQTLADLNEAVKKAADEADPVFFSYQFRTDLFNQNVAREIHDHFRFFMLYRFDGGTEKLTLDTLKRRVTAVKDEFVRAVSVSNPSAGGPIRLGFTHPRDFLSFLNFSLDEARSYEPGHPINGLLQWLESKEMGRKIPIVQNWAHCYGMSFVVQYYFHFVKFDPEKPKESDATYRDLIKKIFDTSNQVRVERSIRFSKSMLDSIYKLFDDQYIFVDHVIPGYQGLNDFSRDFEDALKTAIMDQHVYQNFSTRAMFDLPGNATYKLAGVSTAHQARQYRKIKASLAMGTTCLISMFWDAGGHAVLVTSLEKDGTLEAVFNIWDPNNTKKFGTVTFNKAEGRWTYDDGWGDPVDFEKNQLMVKWVNEEYRPYTFRYPFEMLTMGNFLRALAATRGAASLLDMDFDEFKKLFEQVVADDHGPVAGLPPRISREEFEKLRRYVRENARVIDQGIVRNPRVADFAVSHFPSLARTAFGRGASGRGSDGRPINYSRFGFDGNLSPEYIRDRMRRLDEAPPRPATASEDLVSIDQGSLERFMRGAEKTRLPLAFLEQLLGATRTFFYVDRNRKRDRTTKDGKLRMVVFPARFLGIEGVTVRGDQVTLAPFDDLTPEAVGQIYGYLAQARFETGNWDAVRRSTQEATRLERQLARASREGTTLDREALTAARQAYERARWGLRKEQGGEELDSRFEFQYFKYVYPMKLDSLASKLRKGESKARDWRELGEYWDRADKQRGLSTPALREKGYLAVTDAFSAVLENGGGAGGLFDVFEGERRDRTFQDRRELMAQLESFVQVIGRRNDLDRYIKTTLIPSSNAYARAYGYRTLLPTARNRDVLLSAIEARGTGGEDHPTVRRALVAAALEHFEEAASYPQKLPDFIRMTQGMTPADQVVADVLLAGDFQDDRDGTVRGVKAFLLAALKGEREKAGKGEQNHLEDLMKGIFAVKKDLDDVLNWEFAGEVFSPASAGEARMMLRLAREGHYSKRLILKEEGMLKYLSADEVGEVLRDSLASGGWSGPAASGRTEGSGAGEVNESGRRPVEEGPNGEGDSSRPGETTDREGGGASSSPPPARRVPYLAVHDYRKALQTYLDKGGSSADASSLLRQARASGQADGWAVHVLEDDLAIQTAQTSADTDAFLRRKVREMNAASGDRSALDLQMGQFLQALARHQGAGGGTGHWIQETARIYRTEYFHYTADMFLDHFPPETVRGIPGLREALLQVDPTRRQGPANYNGLDDR